MNFKESILRETLLFDGSISSELIRRKLLNDKISQEVMVLTHPADIMDIHLSYLAAGADIITTNTFALTSPLLMQNYSIQCRNEIVAAAVTLAKEAITLSKKEALIALSLGPTGEFFAPEKALSQNEIYDMYYSQALNGAAFGADIVLIESMASLQEARIAVIAAKKACKLPIVLSFSVGADGNTLAGNTPEVIGHCAHVLGVECVGINCSQGPDEDYDTFSRLQAASCLPALALPSAGVPFLNDENILVYPYSPYKMKESMSKYVASGACAIGGGRGTTPSHIAMLADLISSIDKSPQQAHYVDAYICSNNTILPLEQAINAKPLSLPDDVDDAVKLVNRKSQNAKVLNLLLSGKSKRFIADLINNLSVANHIPLCFTVAYIDEAIAALYSYEGVAAVFSDGDTYNVARACAKYGAHLIE